MGRAKSNQCQRSGGTFHEIIKFIYKHQTFHRNPPFMKRIFLLPSICSYGTRTFISSYPNDMANTYTQIHIQFVFAVKYRAALIRKEWKDRLHQYSRNDIL